MVLFHLSFEDLELVLEGADLLFQFRVLLNQDVFFSINVFNFLGEGIWFLDQISFQVLNLVLKLILRPLVLSHFLVLWLESGDLSLLRLIRVLHFDLLRVESLDLLSVLVSLLLQVLDSLVFVLDLSNQSFLVFDRQLLIFLDPLLWLSKAFFEFSSSHLSFLQLLDYLLLFLFNAFVQLQFVIKSLQSLSQMTEFKTSLWLLA